MKHSFKRKLPLLLAASFLFLLACNNESEKKDSTDTTTVKADSTAPKPMTTHSIRPVFLEPSDLIDLLDADNNNNTPKMIYFEFDFGQGGSDVVVRAHARDSAGNKLPDVDIPLAPDNMAAPISFQYSEQYPYSNIIVRGHLKAFLGYPTRPGETTYANRPIPAGDFKKTILLTPCLNDQGKLRFIMTYADANKPKCSETSTMAGRITSNPSPPGTPACMGDCDNSTFTFMVK